MFDVKELDYLKLIKTGAKFLAGILAVVLIIVFFGAPVREIHQDSYNQILQRGVLRVGVSMDMPKLGTKENDQLVGLEPDLAKKIAQNIFGETAAPALVSYDTRTKQYALENDEVDLLICQSTTTEFSQENYRFSDAYFTEAVSFMAANGGNLKLEDLAGKKVACIYKSDAQTDFVAEVKNRGLTLEVYEYASYPEAAAALQAGQVDAFAEETLVLFKYLPQGYSVSEERFATRSFCVVALKNNTELMRHVQDTLKSLEQSGQMDEIRQKWGF